VSGYFYLAVLFHHLAAMSTIEGENKQVSVVTTSTNDNMALKSFVAATVKLNDTNYLLWGTIVVCSLVGRGR